MVVKRFDFTNCLNTTVPLSEVESTGVVPSFCIKGMKRRTLLVCILKQSIKKGMFSGLGKLSPHFSTFGYASKNFI